MTTFDVYICEFLGKLDSLVAIGERIAVALEEANWLATAKPCPKCGGTKTVGKRDPLGGHIIFQICDRCRGKGKVAVTDLPTSVEPTAMPSNGVSREPQPT